MDINRVWAMPNKWTFAITPIRNLIEVYAGNGGNWIDPFSGQSSIAEKSNDIDPATPAEFHMDGLDYLKGFSTGIWSGVLFDPPYSLRQIKELYNDKGHAVSMRITEYKKEIARLVRPGGYVIRAGWSSNGIGKKYGFALREILLVAHGSEHNDTIVTVEKRVQNRKVN